MIDTERALMLATKIVEKRAELRVLEEQFAAYVDGRTQLAAVPDGKIATNAERVLKVFEASPSRLFTPGEVSKSIADLGPKYIQLLVARLEKAGRITKAKRGFYGFKAAVAA